MSESSVYDLPPAPEVMEEPKKKNKTLIIILIIVGVLLLCCCVAAVIGFFAFLLPEMQNSDFVFNILLPMLA